MTIGAEQYWHAYYAPAVVAQALGTIETHTVASTDIRLHVDVYPQPPTDAPTVLVNHGGGGYSGLLVSLALALHGRGYTVVVPDQKGQGLSGGALGDFTLPETIRNIVDVAAWARKRFAGPLYLAGAGTGGGLTYYAAAALARAGAPPAAIACLNLFDFGDPRTALRLTRFAPLAKLRPLATCSLAAARALAKVGPVVRLPYRPLTRFAQMIDPRAGAAGFGELFARDPYILWWATARHFASALRTAPEVPFEANRVPVLVLNQRRDRMIDPAMTRASFERLAGPKEYHEIDWGHFSLQPEFNAAVAGHMDTWFTRHTPGGTG